MLEKQDAKFQEEHNNINKQFMTETGKSLGVSEHAKTCHGIIDWSKVGTLKVETITFERKIREAIEIQYYQTGPRDGGMNQDDGNYMTKSFWKPMLQYVNTKTLH